MEQAQPNPQERYIASVRTALSGPEDSILCEVPEAYIGKRVKSVNDTINYLTDDSNISGDDLATASSIKGEMKGEYTIEVNGRPANASDPVKNLFIEKDHRGVPYQALDIEVASVQEGGLVKLLV